MNYPSYITSVRLYMLKRAEESYRLHLDRVYGSTERINSVAHTDYDLRDAQVQYFVCCNMYMNSVRDDENRYPETDMITHTQPAPQTAPTPPRTNRERRKPHNHALRRLVLSANAIALTYEALCRDAGVPVRTDLIDTLNFAVDDLRQYEADRAADAMRTGGGNSQ